VKFFHFEPFINERKDWKFINAQCKMHFQILIFDKMKLFLDDYTGTSWESRWLFIIKWFENISRHET